VDRGLRFLNFVAGSAASTPKIKIRIKGAEVRSTSPRGNFVSRIDSPSRNVLPWIYLSMSLRACRYKDLTKVPMPSIQILYSQRASKNSDSIAKFFTPICFLSRSTMGSSPNPVDHTRNFGLASNLDSSKANSQRRSNYLPSEETKFPTRELQERFQGKSKDIQLPWLSNYRLTEKVSTTKTSTTRKAPIS
jgi:hypothetical protein